jgi:hypothetical protein
MDTINTNMFSLLLYAKFDSHLSPTHDCYIVLQLHDAKGNLVDVTVAGNKVLFAKTADGFGFAIQRPDGSISEHKKIALACSVGIVQAVHGFASVDDVKPDTLRIPNIDCTGAVVNRQPCGRFVTTA